MVDSLPDRTIRIGTRGSRLARWQADWVAARLRELHPGLQIEVSEIKTRGDRDRHSPLADIGGDGLFTKEIQRAVQDGSVDIAVHSLKDLPTLQPLDLTLAAVPVREDVADALIAPTHQTIRGLPAGGRVGTSSPRRRAQLLHLRPDLQIISLRGNVETRLNQALEGKLDGVVIASAGLRRLALDRHITERLEPPLFLPAVGQGALGIECRRAEVAIVSLLEPLDHQATRRAIAAERALLAALNGGCTLPIAAWARELLGKSGPYGGLVLALDAAVFALDGSSHITVDLAGSGDDPDGLGQRAATALRDRGATRLLENRQPE
jgi:hydroxymethylbilane synthase